MIKVYERDMMAVAPPIEYVNHVSFSLSLLVIMNADKMN